jgi:hypothetical protein
MQRGPLLLGQLRLRHTGLDLVGQLLGLGNGLEPEQRRAEVGVGGLLEVERLEDDNLVLDAAFPVGGGLGVAEALGLALALEAFGGSEGVEELGAVAEEDGLDGRVFAFAFCLFGGLVVVVGRGGPCLVG